MTQQTIATPGIGALFHRKDATDQWQQRKTPRSKQVVDRTGVVSIFTGYIVLPGGQRLIMQARFMERTQKFECKVLEPDTWKLMSEFEIPAFCGQNYVDSTMPIGTRKYRLRAIRVSKIDEDGFTLNYIRLRLPQVTQVSSRHPAFS